MRDEAFSDHDSDTARGGSRLGAASAAVVSVALLAVLVGWSYNLGVRDAGDVPVIRALEGAMRERPSDPGGARFAHQDRQIYDLMAGSADIPADVVIAAPAEALVDEDVPFGSMTGTEPVSLPSMTESEAEAPGLSLDDLVVAALAGPDGSSAAVGSSPLAPPRPERAAALTRVAAATPAQEAPAVQNDAALLAPGRPAIQLGAYQSEEMARAMWQEISTRNGDLLAGRQPVVTPLAGSSRTLHALRAAPFSDEAEARRLCDALRSRSEDCLVTELR